ncbi:MAG TPA: redoxin domain-containing protein [Ignavibacteria bacterium]|nr:redoxin domain-containing protein [Ignavibacteria bacterium]
MGRIQVKMGFLAALLMFLAGSITFSGGHGLSVGETSPNPEFLYENNYDITAGLRSTVNLYNYKEDKTLLVAFMPDISSANSYAEVMTSAFEIYFAKGMAFVEPYEWQLHRKNLKVLIVTNNDQSLVRDYLYGNGYEFDMAPDVNMDFAHSFGITKWNSPGEGSFVYIVDKNNKITYANHDYKGEGEKLRAVQKELLTQLNIAGSEDIMFAGINVLFPGDTAPDFDFTYSEAGGNNFIAGGKGKLSDFIGKKNVILAFYPAPFSVSCAMELTTFDSYAEKQTLQNISNTQLGSADDLEILMVSNSGLGILDKWKNDMNVKNVKLVSDLFGEISHTYASYNMLGYNNRTLFIIDKRGKISYIDWNYIVDEQDFSMVKDHLELIKTN